MNDNAKLLLVHELMGSKHLTRTLCFIAKYYDVPGIVLLGNTVSPEIIDWLKYRCKVEVLGVLGRYDEASIASKMRALNGLIECRIVNIGGITIYGYGFSGCSPELDLGVEIDVFATSIPGLKYSCCGARSDMIDAIVETLNPRLVVTGGCEKPCFNSKVFAPGSIQKGFIGVVEGIDRKLFTSWINAHGVIYNIIHSSLNNEGEIFYKLGFK
ncbi:MAG: phosphoesterase [Desulfurococcaceae archaeon]